MSPRLKCLFAVVLLAAGTFFVQGQARENEPRIAINKLPLRDFGVAARRKIESGEVDINAVFRLEYEVKLDSSGKIDRSRSRIINSEGDEKVVGLVRDAILAISDSGWFAYFQRLDLGSNIIRIAVAQTKETFDVSLRCSATSADKAKYTASALSTLLTVAVTQSERLPSADLLFLERTKVTSDGPELLIKFSVTGNEVREMIRSGIAEKTAR